MWIHNSEDEISRVYYLYHWYHNEFMLSKNYILKKDRTLRSVINYE